MQKKATASHKYFENMIWAKLFTKDKKIMSVRRMDMHLCYLCIRVGGLREPHLHISTPAAFKDNVHQWCQEVFKMVRCADVQALQVVTQPSWVNTHWTHGAFDSFVQKLDRIHYLRVLINPSHSYNLNIVVPHSNIQSLIGILIRRRFSRRGQQFLPCWNFFFSTVDWRLENER